MSPIRKYTVNRLSDGRYSCIVTFLTHEVNVDDQLKRLEVRRDGCEADKVVVDLALVSDYRFVEFSVGEDGRIDVDSRKFVSLPENEVVLANRILAGNRVAVASSFLPKSQKDYLLGAC